MFGCFWIYGFIWDFIKSVVSQLELLVFRHWKTFVVPDNLIYNVLSKRQIPPQDQNCTFHCLLIINPSFNFAFYAGHPWSRVVSCALSVSRKKNSFILPILSYNKENRTRFKWIGLSDLQLQSEILYFILLTSYEFNY